MRRRIAVVGDTLTGGGQILDYEQITGFRFHGNKAALIGHKAYCETCKSTGTLAKAASGTAELSPAFGSALFAIVDDADVDARAKADYLQRYVCALQRQGMIAGTCSLTDEGGPGL
jgi:hypothetical protein